MARLLALLATHALRMLAGAAVVWASMAAVSLLGGLVLRPFLPVDKTVVAVFSGIFMFVPLVLAGYLSFRLITPGSLLHALSAGFLGTFAFLLVNGSGPVYFSVGFAMLGGLVSVCTARLVDTFGSGA